MADDIRGIFKQVIASISYIWSTCQVIFLNQNVCKQIRPLTGPPLETESAIHRYSFGKHKKKPEARGMLANACLKAAHLMPI